MRLERERETELWHAVREFQERPVQTNFIEMRERRGSVRREVQWKFQPHRENGSPRGNVEGKNAYV